MKLRLLVATLLGLAIVAAGRADAAPADNVAPVPPPSSFIAPAHSCISVPMVFTRVDATGVRGYSVTFHLSSNLSLCGSITAGTYLSSVNPNASLQVTDNSGGSYTVDQAILGDPCGATGSATLFTVPVTSSAPGGVGSITVDSVQVRDCANLDVPGAPGDTCSIPIDNLPPTGLADLSATQQLSGNPAGSTTNINLNWSAPEPGATVHVYRKGFGSYPEYSDADGTGLVPLPPATPAAALSAGWAASVTAPGADHTASRDFYYFVAFVTDSGGNVSSVSNMTSGTLNYFLGDVTDSTNPGTGDNKVGPADLSLLGAHYGLKNAAVAPFAYLDFGPTTDRSASARPAPDDKIGFEDLMVMALNYNLVSRPGLAAPAAVVRDQIAMDVIGGPASGDLLSARVSFAGTGRVQGVSARFRWNPDVVRPEGFSTGDLLEQQGGMAASEAAGSVDAVLLGRNQGLRGSGGLVTQTFRRIAAGDAGIALASVEARDTRNRLVDIEGAARGGQGVLHYALRPAVPNPSRGGTALGYSLAAAGHVELAIFSVDGRRVRTLVSSEAAAGDHQALWDGLDGRGIAVSPGVYFARLVTPGGSLTRALTVLH